MSSAEADDRFPYPLEDPETVGAQRKALHNLGMLLLDSHADVNDDVLLTTESWRSDSAITAVADTRDLATMMRTDSQAIADAVPTLTTYIGRIEHARERIDGIRRRYDEAKEARNVANAHPPADLPPNMYFREEYRDGNQHVFEGVVGQLQVEHDDVLADLTADSRPAVEALRAAIEVMAPDAPSSMSLDQVAWRAATVDLTLVGDTDYEYQLRDAGLLTGPSPGGYYAEWLQNAEDNGVDVRVLMEIIEQQGITPDSFTVLDGLEEVVDGDGKSFFILPDDISAEDARLAVLMTYILNAGTDYGDTADINSYEDTPYSAAEVQRIIDRQSENGWSYDEDVPFVHDNGGVLATTPNGMLMGLGGNWLQDLYSLNGGTTFGDIFMLNVDDPEDADEMMREIIRSGSSWYANDDDDGYHPCSLDLDRLLHHEEIHSQQYAALGRTLFFVDYLLEQGIAELPFTDENWYERDAGLEDGGY